MEVHLQEMKLLTGGTGLTGRNDLLGQCFVYVCQTFSSAFKKDVLPGVALIPLIPAP